jgi:AraC-like DNA-binding protein
MIQPQHHLRSIVAPSTKSIRAAHVTSVGRGIAMSSIESFTTEGLSPRQRRHFWSELTSRVFTPLETEPYCLDAFNAQLHRTSLGALSLSRAISAPASVVHSAQSARQTGGQVFLLHLQAHGSSVNRQDGREAQLLPGDFTLCDSSRPYSVRFDQPNDMLVMRIAAPLLRDRLTQPEDVTAYRVSGSQGVGALVSSMLQQLWAQSERGLDERVVDRLGANFLDLLVTALCAQEHGRASGGSVANAQRLRVRYYIEDHLTSPDLDANAIATALQISPRYVHRLFESSDETLGQHVLRRRLEESARRLHDPAHGSRSAMEIAYDCGFTDASYFTRCFRRRFGVTPREYRRR